MRIHLQPGDLIPCWGTSRQCRAISWGTASAFGPRRLRIGPSHVAIAANWQGQTVWIESTTLCPHRCLVLGDVVNGCQAHRPEERVADYVNAGGRVEVYRLSPIDSLDVLEERLLSTILMHHFVMKRVGYDVGGAMISGTRLLKLTRFMPGADLQQLFCSELCAAVLQRLGRMNRSNPTRFNPACLMRRVVTEGTYEFVEEFRG